ncbi:AI-2E family transporter [Vibrio parahaemolyticus]|nr:AI-2E family transporter [Vibrio parahaemolyticus]
MELSNKKPFNMQESVRLSVLWFVGFFAFVLLLIAMAEPVAIALALGFNLIVIRDHLGVKLRGYGRAMFVLVSVLLLGGYYIFSNLNHLVRDFAGMATDVGQIARHVTSQLKAYLPINEISVGQLVDGLMMAYDRWVADLLSMTTVTTIVTVMVYIALVPILVMMFLVEHSKILPSIYTFMPKKAMYAKNVLAEWLVELEEYVWCKNIEGLIITIASYLMFDVLFGLNYSFVLSIMVGLSVFVPFVGPLLVAFPIAAVAAVQFSSVDTLAMIVVAYTILQTIEGFVLSPWLFGKRLELSPLAVLCFIVLLGALFGLWGVLLTVPVLTFVRSCQVCYDH